MQRILFICLIVIFTPVAARAAEDAAGLKQFRGRWRITELTDNGSFISPERIKNWLPSGGKIEFGESRNSPRIHLFIGFIFTCLREFHR